MCKAGPTDRGRAGESGYTYPVILILMVAAALAVQAASIPPAGRVQSDREAELLFRGEAYRAAIASYWEAGGSGGTFPARLQDLISDPRLEGRRHIRRLYDDPMPGGGWRVIEDPRGGISGVASTAPGTPRRQAFFPAHLGEFEASDSYGNWRFVFDPDAG